MLEIVERKTATYRGDLSKVHTPVNGFGLEIQEEIGRQRVVSMVEQVL